MKNLSLFAVWSIFLFFSCREPIDFPRPAHQPELAVFAQMDQEGVSVFLTETLDSRDNSQLPLVDDAEVKISNESKEYSLPYNFGIDQYQSFDLTPESGKSYELTIRKEGFETLKSTVVMPPPIAIENIEIELFDSIVLDTNRRRLSYLFSLELDEEFASPDFYEINTNFGGITRIEINDTTSILATTRLFPNILPAKDSNPIELENNNIFFVEGGKSSVIEFIAEFDFQKEGFAEKVNINLKATTLDRFNFRSSQLAQQTTDDDASFLLEPVSIQSNIENGHGLFEASYIVTIDKDMPR